jgi:hypothetical protein
MVDVYRCNRLFLSTLSVSAFKAITNMSTVLLHADVPFTSLGGQDRGMLV